MVKTPCFHRGGQGFISGQGTEIPQTVIPQAVCVVLPPKMWHTERKIRKTTHLAEYYLCTLPLHKQVQSPSRAQTTWVLQSKDYFPWRSVYTFNLRHRNDEFIVWSLPTCIIYITMKRSYSKWSAGISHSTAIQFSALIKGMLNLTLSKSKEWGAIFSKVFVHLTSGHI